MRCEISIRIKIPLLCYNSTRMRLIARLLFIYFALVALLSPFSSWDSWEYHLPFSSFIWKIGGGETTFHLSPQMYERFLGFPLAAEFFQGFFWWITGAMNTVVLPHLILLVIYFFFIRRLYKVEPGFTILAFFACPLLFIHFFSTYVDLFCGLSLALSFLFLNQIFLSIYEKKQIGTKNGFLFLFFLSLSANTKYQGWFSSMLVSVVFFEHLIFCRERGPVRKRLFILLGLALILINLSTTKNFIFHRNPFYPIRVVIGQNVLWEGPEKEYKNPISYMGNNPVLSFLVSSTELDWHIRNVPRKYTLDSSHTGPRTGGFGEFFFFLNLGLLIIQIFNFSSLTDPLQKISVINISTILVGTSFFPQSHELRYWLYLPLILIPVNLRFVLKTSFRMCINLNFIWTVLALLVLFCFFSEEIIKDTKILQWPPAVSTQSERRSLELPGLQAQLDEKGIFCLSRFDLFKYSKASTGREGILSMNESDCTK